MNKRYQVFVSSTYEDLKRPRQEVMTTLLESDCIPSGMELFPAADDDQWTVIKQIIDECDYYIILLAGKYGSIGKERISYSEMEYDYAQEKTKPTLVFIHKDIGSLPSKDVESDASKRDKLNQFREKLSKNRLCKFWTSPEELAGYVSRAINTLKKTHPAEGWVRGSSGIPAEAIEELLKLRKENEKLQRQIEIISTEPPADSEKLAQGKDELILDILITIREYRKIKENTSVDYIDQTYNLKTTWDEVFINIGPSMIDQIAETTVKSRLKEYAKRVFSDKELEIEGQSKGEVTRRLDDIRIDPTDVNKIVFQFQALGMIARLKSDSSKPYWQLTTYGERYMRSLFAVLKN